MEWKLFNERIARGPTMATDEAGGMPQAGRPACCTSNERMGAGLNQYDAQTWNIVPGWCRFPFSHKQPGQSEPTPGNPQSMIKVCYGGEGTWAGCGPAGHGDAVT